VKLIVPPELERPFWLFWLTYINVCVASEADLDRWWVMVIAIAMWPAIAALGDLLENHREWRAHRKKIDEAFHGG